MLWVKLTSVNCGSTTARSLLSMILRRKNSPLFSRLYKRLYLARTMLPLAALVVESQTGLQHRIRSSRGDPARLHAFRPSTATAQRTPLRPDALAGTRQIHLTPEAVSRFDRLIQVLLSRNPAALALRHHLLRRLILLLILLRILSLYGNTPVTNSRILSRSLLSLCYQGLTTTMDIHAQTRVLTRSIIALKRETWMHTSSSSYSSRSLHRSLHITLVLPNPHVRPNPIPIPHVHPNPSPSPSALKRMSKNRLLFGNGFGIK